METVLGKGFPQRCVGAVAAVADGDLAVARRTPGLGGATECPPGQPPPDLVARRDDVDVDEVAAALAVHERVADQPAVGVEDEPAVQLGVEAVFGQLVAGVVDGVVGDAGDLGRVVADEFVQRLYVRVVGAWRTGRVTGGQHHPAIVPGPGGWTPVLNERAQYSDS
ncbi:MAG: hypothetical protein M3422_12410 [Actinomycetota bacterium]|nr:hypothetical protein [Actinomycetota bacterium]